MRGRDQRDADRSCPTPRRSARACGAARCRPRTAVAIGADTISPSVHTITVAASGGRRGDEAVAAKPHPGAARSRVRSPAAAGTAASPSRVAARSAVTTRPFSEISSAVDRGRVAVGDHLQRQRRLLLEVDHRARRRRSPRAGRGRRGRRGSSAPRPSRLGRDLVLRLRAGPGGARARSSPNTADVAASPDEDEQRTSARREPGDGRPGGEAEVDREPVGGEGGHPPALRARGRRAARSTPAGTTRP